MPLLRWCATLTTLVLLGQPGSVLTRSERYHPLPWSAEISVSAKNFAWFALIEAQPAAKRAVADAPILRAFVKERREAVARAARECAVDVQCHTRAFTWSDDEIARAREAIGGLARSGALASLIDEMRRSGLFERDRALEPEAMLVRTWERSAAALNNIISVYGLGQKPPYPAIDAVSHDVTAESYGRLLNTVVGVLDEQGADWQLFYQPTLAFALQLLDVNWRDEAGRFEPLHLGENSAAYKRVSAISWPDYPYTVIVVPGAGGDRPDMPLSPGGRLRLALAARRFHERKAPFVLVSGGYVHPSQTKFNEALEMKRSLMRDFRVPEDAILIDPHARHTTTNLRNAARIMFRYGIPTDRPSMITTDQYQSGAIESAAFGERCERELATAHTS